MEDRVPSLDRPRLVFVGSPLLDITARCETDLLAHYALQADGCTVATDQHDTLFERLLRGGTVKVGGSALNSARIAQWAAENKARVSFAGCVGDDEYASRIAQELESDGVEPLLISVKGASTGACACLLSHNGERRSMCTRNGAAALFQKTHLCGTIRERLAEADCIFVTGYLLSHSPDVVFEIADKCHPNQILALSLSAEYVCRDFKDVLLQVLPRVDVLMGNELEVMALSDVSLTVEEAASVIAHWRGTRIVVVSRGPDPVLFVRGQEPPRHFLVPQIMPILDSVGCGDALAGAFLAVFTMTGNSEEAVQIGIVVATEIGQMTGCHLPSRRLEDLRIET